MEGKVGDGKTKSQEYVIYPYLRKTGSDCKLYRLNFLVRKQIVSKMEISRQRLRMRMVLAREVAMVPKMAETHRSVKEKVLQRPFILKPFTFHLHLPNRVGMAVKLSL